VASLGAGWCPPGILGLGVGGTAERAMLMAKQALMEPIDMPRIRASGPRGALEAFRLDLHDRINALGIGAQGLGGITTVLDVKVRTFATHAASLPVALIPNCAATRHVSFELDGSGPATLEPPDSADWPEILLDQAHAASRAVNLDTLTAAETASWRIGETLRLSGRLLTARDAAHRRLVELLARGECPVPLAGRVIYYVGPVTPVGGEAEGPAGPTTASRMDPFMDVMLGHGVLANIGKAERGPAAIAAIRRHRAPYLIGVGGAALLISKAIRASRLVAFPELGMEAVRELEVVDMPVTVAVDVEGRSLHAEGPRAWRTAPSRAGPHLAP
jgi:fumarate hydratase class I